MARTIIALAALALAVTQPAMPAQAGAPRTFVSAAGTDNSTCSFAAPCRHFQAAVDATSPGGEVDALDPAGYGPITITQAITIEGQGWSYIAPPANGNAITINAVSGKVTIRGVSLNGVGMSNAVGILFDSGASLNVQNSVIENFSRYGILFEPNASSKISVSNTVVSDNTQGIYIGPTGSGATNGVLDHVHTENNTGDGITIIGAQPINVTVADSVIANNGGDGVVATTTNGGNGVRTFVRNSTIVNNGGAGLDSVNPAGTLLFSRNTIESNGAGYESQNSGGLGSYGDNNVDFNIAFAGSLPVSPYK